MSVPRQEVVAQFSNFVDQEVLSALKTGSESFAEIVKCAPSIYPTEVAASIKRLADAQEISPHLAETLVSRPVTPMVQIPEISSLLPLPHPLDFEWRFAPHSSHFLLNLAIDATPFQGHILLFGTPGLATEALSHPSNRRRRMSFFSEDNAVTRRLVLLNKAVNSPLTITYNRNRLPQAFANAVIVDPPWYLEIMLPMLETAAAACKEGGVIFFCAPPIGTRPSAETERVVTYQFFERTGLDLLDYQPLSVVYDTPFFERNALAAAGVYAPSRWRRGDLLILHKKRRASCTVRSFQPKPNDWIEVSINTMRVFIRMDRARSVGTQGLIGVIDGDVLPSVSRRDGRRQLADVWTTGNRIFSTDNSALLVLAASILSENTIPPCLHATLWDRLHTPEALERVSEDLLALAEVEADEEYDSPSLLSNGVRREHPVRSYLAAS